MPDKIIHQIQVDGYCARFGGKWGRLQLGTFGSYGIEQLQITLGDSWTDLVVYANFVTASGSIPVLVPESGLVDVPPEATAKPGMGNIVLDGTADGVRIYSVDIPYIMLNHSDLSGEAPAPTPDRWEQYVAQVKGYADAAAESAKGAAASEQNAADSAERAAQAAGEAAGSISQVQDAAKAALDDIATERETALEAVQTEGSKQESAIAGSGTAALEAIGQVEQAAINQVQQAGAEQVDSVNAAGNAQLDKINAANALVPTPTQEDAGKSIIVKSDGSGYELGDIVTDAYTKAESDARYAPIAAAIRPTVSGNPATLEHSVAWAMQGLSVYGKSTQATTTGAQLIDAQAWQTADSEYYKVAKDGGMVQLKADNRGTQDIPMFLALEAGEYTASVNSGFILQIIKDDVDLVAVNYINHYKATFTLDSPATIGMKVYEHPSTNIYPSSVAYPMINSGSTALPWEPYTGGRPSPSPDYPQEIVTAGGDGTIDITVSDNADQSQQLSIQTPNGLPGIPVDSGGTYTDADGQQWICDEVDFERGVYVQRVKAKELNPDDNWAYSKTKSGNNNFQIRLYNIDTATSGKPCFCNILPYKNAVWDDNSQNLPKIYAYTVEITTSFPPNSEYSSLETFKKLLTDVKSVIYYVLAAPIETPLSAEELAAYAALRSYNGTTVISTEAPVAGLSARYVADGAAYIDGKIQSAVTQAVAAAVSLTGGAQ